MDIKAEVAYFRQEGQEEIVVPNKAIATHARIDYRTSYEGQEYGTRVTLAVEDAENEHTMNFVRQSVKRAIADKIMEIKELEQ